MDVIRQQRQVHIQFELMEDRQDKIKRELDVLINHLCKNNQESVREEMHSYANRVFSTGPGRPNNDSAPELQQKITQRVAQRGDQRVVIDCQDTTQRFLGNHSVHRKHQILRMLLKMSELNQRQDSINIFRQTRARDLNITKESVQTSANNNTYLTGTIGQPRRAQSLDHIKMARNRGLVDQKFTQNDLVRQLIFIFGNNSSNDIVDFQDSYQLRTSIIASQTVRKMVRELSELGWLHKQIIKNSDKKGIVGKALKLGVSEELNQYYRWIGSMETLAKAGRLSLRKLVNWSFQPELILRQLAVVVQAVGAFEGTNMISIVNSFRPSGIASVQALLDRLLGFLIQPLLNYIHSWVYLGDLQDERGQFFISENPKVSDSEEWTERFQLVLERVPNVLDIESAKKIFIAGKTIYFLRNRCEVVYNLRTKFPQTRNGNGLMGLQFSQWLTQTHQEVSSVLVDVLMNRFNLKYHLLSMKNFFLCGKGDFIQQLYDSLREKLSQKKHEVNEHSLDGYISDAIGKCFNDYELPNKQSYRSAVLDRLIAKKIDYGPGGGGWDCFNLQYVLDNIEPMQALLSPEIMMNYQKIFYFLWKIKQIQDVTKNIWIMQSRNQTTQMRKARGQEVGALFHSCYILRNSMNHFLHSLFSYLMVSIQTSWDKFCQALDKALTFDEILKLHKEFQQQILDTTLSTPKGKSIYAALSNIFAVITNFKAISFNLQQNYEQYYQKWRVYLGRQDMARKGLLGNQSLEIPSFESGKLSKSVNQSITMFNTTFKNFYNQISKEGESKLSSLSFKLDYSQYYCNIFAE